MCLVYSHKQITLKNIIRNKVFDSPFYIFINSEKDETKHILEVLGLDKWNLIVNNNFDNFFKSPNKHFYTTWIDGWFHIMDDWNYSLWHDKTLSSNLQKLSQQYRIFTCSIGDIDESFDFRLYDKGELQREYVVEDFKLNGGEVIRNLGKPLKGETEALKIRDLSDKVIRIAQSIGINTLHRPDQISTHCNKTSETEEFKFDDTTT